MMIDLTPENRRIINVQLFKEKEE